MSAMEPALKHVGVRLSSGVRCAMSIVYVLAKYHTNGVWDWAKTGRKDTDRRFS